MHVKKGDEVTVLSGKDQRLRGEVLEVDPKKNRVKVARRNMIVKHRKPNPMTGDEGARVEVEGWLHASNVGLYSEEHGGPVRTGKKFVGDGGELYDSKQDAWDSFGDTRPERIQKVRVAKQTGEVFDDINPS